jgi:hypothetical protein
MIDAGFVAVHKLISSQPCHSSEGIRVEGIDCSTIQLPADLEALMRYRNIALTQTFPDNTL